MRILVGLLMIAAACVLSTTAASAQNFPFCLKGCSFGYNDCNFTSYQQCQASASGLTAWCEANPYYRAANDVQPAGHARYSKRRL
jgi:hypothetical protein